MRKSIIILIVVATLGLLLCLSPLGQALIWVVMFSRAIDARTALVTDPENYTPAAKALARLCESGFLEGEPSVHSTVLAPPEVLRLNPNSFFVSANESRVEFGGGFHHFGYLLERESQPTPDADASSWALSFYSESQSPRLLYKFELPSADRLDHDEFVDGVLREYHRRAASFARDDEVCERIDFLFQQNRPRLARQSVFDFAARHENDWLDKILAMVIADPDDSKTVRSVEHWARGKNGFSAWLLLAYAANERDDAAAMNRYVELALEYPADDPDWLQYNARHRGTPMAAHLYAAGHFGSAVALCDSLLRYDGDDYRREELQVIRRAAKSAQSGTPTPEIPELDPERSFNPFHRIDLSRLRNVGPPTTAPAAREE